MSPLADWEQSVVTGHPTHPVFFIVLGARYTGINRTLSYTKHALLNPR